jgi:signal peptidase I
MGDQNEPRVLQRREHHWRGVDVRIVRGVVVCHNRAPPRVRIFDALAIEGRLLDLIIVYLLALLLYLAVTRWMLLDAVRRGRGWIRWQVLLHVVSLFVAVPVWLVRRRRWPVAVEIDRPRRRKLTALALGIVAASFTLSPTVGWLVTTYLYQVARVEGAAMSPTINDQDRLIVNKRVYRAGAPAIGDIVMLRYPRDPEKTFVKRVIATGGDEVHIVGGVVFRNGRETDEPYLIHRSQDGWGPEVVPEGTYFVMGDRRNNSSDSRHWGFVPREYVLGRVTMRWWPLSAQRRF